MTERGVTKEFFKERKLETILTIFGEITVNKCDKIQRQLTIWYYKK